MLSSNASRNGGRYPSNGAICALCKAKRRKAEVMRLSLEHARQVLPLASAPLFRVRVLRLHNDEHLMLWNAHHAICDGWSVGLLARDLMHFYGELLAGREPAPTNSLDYGDYAVWLDQQRRTPEYEVHRSYWKRRLRGFRIPELPLSWRNPDSEPAASVIHSRLLPRALTDRLTAVSQRHNATFFHAALSVFALLLRAQQQSPEVAIGTPVSGRDQSELEDIVGTFVNYVPLRFRPEGHKHYIDLLHSIRELVTDSLEHSQFRFEDMLTDLAPSGGLAQAGGLTQAGNRLFSAVFICQQDFVRPLTSAGVSLTAIPSVTPGALHPLTVFMVERPDGWRLSCEVDNHTVSAAAGLALLEQFERLMTAVAGHPDESATLLAARAGLAFAPAPEAVSAEVSDASASQLQPAADQIERRLEPVRIPATEFQRRFWQLDKMSPGGTAFHIRIRLELKGELNVGVLRAAVELLTQRHEILRTTLEDKDGQIWQVIHSELPIDFRFISSGSLASEDLFSTRELSADQAILEGEGHAKFSLTHGPLFRVRVLQMAKDRHWLAITLSHGVVDGWSAGLFLEQLQHAYEQCAAGVQKEAETPVPLQFSDYAAAERNLLASGERDRRLAWWSKYLSGVWMPLSLPRDLDGSFIKDGDIRAGLEVTVLAPEAVLLARRFARECQTTLFAVFGALFQTLLFRYSGQQDVLFLTPHANRTDDTETIMGPLADPICLTGHIGDRTTFRELVTRFSEQSMDAMENALPLNVVTPLVDMRVAGGYHPLNQITFFYQRAFVHDMEWKGLRVQSLPDAPSVASSEWQLGIVERGGGISLEFLYDATLYSQRTIQAAGRHFLRLLTRAIAEPEKALSQLEILAPEEIERHSIDMAALPAIESLLPHKDVPPVAAIAPVAISGEGAEIANSAFSQAELDILRIWRQLFKVEELTLDSDFFDLGGHSLLLARLQIAIKKEFNLQLTAAEVFRQPTVASLAAWLERSLMAGNRDDVTPGAPEVHNPRIVPIQPSGVGRPIFVISQSMIFRTLAAELGPDQPVYAIQMLDQDTLAMGAATLRGTYRFLCSTDPHSAAERSLSAGRLVRVRMDRLRCRAAA